MKVNNVMHQGVEVCSPDCLITDVAKLMRKHDVGAIPIGEDGDLLGMVTDRDITCRAVAESQDLSDLKASDIMSENIVFCTENEEVEDAIRIMEDKQVRRLPVMSEDNQMVGILCLGDISHALSHELSGELVEAVATPH